MPEENLSIGFSDFSDLAAVLELKGVRATLRGVLKKGQALVAIEVKSSSADDTDGYEKFKELYAEHITSAFIVGPEGLPLEDFFSIDLKTLFRKKR